MTAPRRDLIIAPSILASDFAQLGEEVRALEAAGADWVHVDVMDGRFVPNITIGPRWFKAIRPHTALPFDVHLMITPADPHLEAFRAAGADWISVHPEAGPHLNRTCRRIRELGAKAGVVFNPSTPVEAVEWMLEEVDLLLVMSVNPGFGGQSFIEGQLRKVERLRAMIDAAGLDIVLEVDGGVTSANAGRCRDAGATALVAGTAVFRGGKDRYAENIRRLARRTGVSGRLNPASGGMTPMPNPVPKDIAAALSAVPGLAWTRALAVAAGRRVAEEWAASPPYRLMLEGPRADSFAAGPRDFRPTDAEAGRWLLAGKFVLAGATMETGGGGDPWDRPSPSRLFAVRLHRFAFASDLLGAGEAGARELLRLFFAWRQVFDRISPFVWGPETLERRVFNLACASRRLSAVASDAEVQMLAQSLAVQARRLLRLSDGPARAAERLCAAAVAGAALAGAAGDGLLRSALPRLSKALAVAVLPDGGVKTRSPEAGLELLLDLLTLDDALLQRGREAPVEVARAIDRLSGALRFFTLGDGRLPSFHGGEAGDAGHIDAARTHEETDAKPFGYAPHAGYHRLNGLSLQVMVDAAAPAAGPWSIAACAHPLALEVSAGRDRLIVNPGWSPDAAAPAGLRLTAGASTVSIGHGSAGRPLTGFLARALGPRLVDAPARVEARRNEDESGVWLELAHDGWVGAYGFLHERRLFLDGRADELRGEDRFAPGAHGSKPESPAPAAFAARFHLHPDVQVSLARDQRSVLLRGASDRGWWFRNDAADVALEPSVWFEHGLPRRSQQVVLRGPIPPEGGRVRWKLAPVEPDAKK